MNLSSTRTGSPIAGKWAIADIKISRKLPADVDDAGALYLIASGGNSAL